MPITVEQAKAQCRVLHDDENDIFPGLIEAARSFIETRTRHIIDQREVTEEFNGFGCNLELTWRPVLSVATVAYTDADGQSQSFADFTVGHGRNPVRIYRNDGAAWPATLSNSSVMVTYTAGHAAPETEAPTLIQAMLLLIGHWYANRETVVVGTISSDLQLAVDALCDQKRPVF